MQHIFQQKYPLLLLQCYYKKTNIQALVFVVVIALAAICPAN